MSGVGLVFMDTARSVLLYEGDDPTAAQEAFYRSPRPAVLERPIFDDASPLFRVWRLLPARGGR